MTILEPTTQKLIDQFAPARGPSLPTLSPTAARLAFAQLQETRAIKQPASVEDRTFPVGPTGPHASASFARWDRRERRRWSCGSTAAAGSSATKIRTIGLIREIAHGTGAAVVFVDYDRSPEARYPVALEQAYAATKSVATHGEELDLDSSRLALAGERAGGNLVAVVSLLAKERGGPAIRFQLMYYPVTDASFSERSYDEFAEGP